MKELSLAISPCPNDVYIFGAWILGLCGEFAQARCGFAFEDVDVLNRLAEGKAFDVIKVSAAKALELTDDYHILRSGGAYGLGDGPKLVRRTGDKSPVRAIAVPGLGTTAASVLRAALKRPESWPEPLEIQPDIEFTALRYDAIVPALLSGEVEAGLLIHETALVPQRYGLEIILDLGKWWSLALGGAPLPLGCILAAKRLGPALIAELEAKIRESLRFARSNQEALWPLLKALAREIDDSTLARHIAAYVNDYSLDCGELGQKALAELGRVKQAA